METQETELEFALEQLSIRQVESPGVLGCASCSSCGGCTGCGMEV